MSNFEATPKIVWDEDDVHHSRVDTCTIIGSREEVSLLFGNEPAGDPERVRMTHRVILNPFAAKQLSVALNRAVADYESRFGALGAGERPPVQDPEARRQKAASVFRLVKTLDVPIGYERSFKMLDDALLSDRFLLGINKKLIDCKAEDRILDICRQMGMPPNLLETFHQALLDGDYVHFGFEDDGSSCIFKVYAEFFDRIQAELRASGETAGPYLLYLGFKWDPFEPARQAVTQYHWHPWLNGAQIVERLAAIADPQRHSHLFETVRNLIDIAAARMPHRDILYLEVTEAGNPRKSFDINLYRGGLQVGELYPLLAGLGQHYALPYTLFRDLYRQIQNQSFGHLAGGISRQGKEFCTVYHGASSLPERRYGSPQDSSVSPKRHLPMGAIRFVEQSDERAAGLLQMVKGLDSPVGIEHSFKISRGQLRPDRFLAGFRRSGVKPERVLEICRRIHMPADFSDRFQEAYEKANIVLFGFEKSGKGCLYKAYLEFNDNWRRALTADPKHPAPFEMFRGFKWDASDPSRQVVTRYTCYPACLLRHMADRAAQFLNRGGNSEPAAILTAILDLAAHRAGPGDFIYFEADEADTRRSSFSINLYRAGLRMAEVYPLLLDAARCYDVSREALHEVYQDVKTHFMGHLAGGIDRQGRDFLTFYYAEKGTSKQDGGPTKANEGSF
jgi:hypothetical protein